MTREEAIEVYNGLINTKIKEAFEFFAPELAGSEDEIHRKWILEYLYDGLRKSDEQFKDHFKSAINWFEKQKEQKPNYCHYGGDPNIERCRCCSVTCSGRLADEQKPAECSEVELTFRGEMVKVKRPFYRDDKGRGYSTTEQDEIVAWNALRNGEFQPKQEWSEEDEDKLNHILEIVHIASGSEASVDEKEELESFLKSLPHVKQEWSKEDNIGWDEAFACVTRAEKAAKNEEELQNAVTAEKWLKEIKFKYYVNPNKQEWSEEDELMRTAIIQTLETLGGRGTTGIQIDWLKSRRPPQYCENCKLKRSVEGWKPSEEKEEPEYYQHFDPDC